MRKKTRSKLSPIDRRLRDIMKLFDGPKSTARDGSKIRITLLRARFYMAAKARLIEEESCGEETATAVVPLL